MEALHAGALHVSFVVFDEAVLVVRLCKVFVILVFLPRASVLVSLASLEH